MNLIKRIWWVGLLLVFSMPALADSVVEYDDDRHVTALSHC